MILHLRDRSVTTWTASAILWNSATGLRAHTCQRAGRPIQDQGGTAAVEKIKLGDAGFLLEPRHEVPVTTSSFGRCQHCYTVGTSYIIFEYSKQSHRYRK
jgi:hypothetical protein